MKTFDRKVLALAEDFLADAAPYADHEARTLAALIQQTIEDFFEFDRVPPSDEPHPEAFRGHEAAGYAAEQAVAAQRLK